MRAVVSEIAEAKREAERMNDAVVFFAMLEAALLHADIIDAEARQRIAVLEQKIAAMTSTPTRVSRSPTEAMAEDAA